MNDGRRDANGLIAGVIGIVLSALAGLHVASGMPSEAPRSKDPQTAAKDGTSINDARRRAIAWATDECRARLAAAVARATTERAVEDAAWTTCPDHPDALD